MSNLIFIVPQDSNPMLFDFFMLFGGIVGDKQFVSYWEKSHLCYLPYLDIYYNGLGMSIYVFIYFII